MRTDENGESCPGTLGEYREMCVTLGGQDCAAVKFLDGKIGESPKGRDEVVIAPDSQMRIALLPMLLEQ